MQCPDCFSREIKEHGFHIGQQRFLCQECGRKFLESTLLQPVSICRHCQREKKIYNQEKWLCKSCYCSLTNQEKIQGKGQVICTECGKFKKSSQSSQNICRRCAEIKNNGYQKCSNCNKIKLIINKKRNLCKFCYSNFTALNGFKKLMQNYQSKFDYNEYLFHLLISEVDLKTVDEKIRSKFSNFGKFLQEQFIPQPITWQIIEDLLPQITSKNVRKTKDIRGCLLALGHLLTHRGQLEDYSEYQKKKLILSKIEKAPYTFQEILSSYASYLEQSSRSLEDIVHHLQVIIHFLSWCENQDIHSLEVLQKNVIQDYIKQLKSEFYCEKCDFYFSCQNDKSSSRCPNCKQINTVVKRENYKTNTIRKYNGKLTVFFDWLKLNRKIIINPAKGLIINHSDKIQHYSEDVIYQLWEYAQSDEADPTKALILYLIIVHAFSKTELFNAQIPQVIPISSNILSPTLESVYAVTLPPSSPSYGRLSPGRPSATIYFSQAAESWLKPLLSRYEVYRHSIVKNPQNPYLFVNLNNAWHIKPVGRTFIQTKVRDVTMEVLGSPCNTELLRKTIAIMYADKTNGAILKQFGWEAQQAFFYTWGDRELINFKTADFASETPENE